MIKIVDIDKVEKLSITLLVLDIMAFLLNKYQFHMIGDITAIIAFVSIAAYAISTFIIAKSNNDMFLKMVMLVTNVISTLLIMQQMVDRYIISEISLDDIDDEYTKDFIIKLKKAFTAKEIEDSLNFTEDKIKEAVKTLYKSTYIDDNIVEYFASIDNIFNNDNGKNVIGYIVEEFKNSNQELRFPDKPDVKFEDINEWIMKVIRE